jgi:hypothetical protein
VTVLIVVCCVFLVLEAANVSALYFQPGTDKFNALGVFRAWEASKAHPEIHDLVRYLAWWVAGTKLIFILLLGAIMAFGDGTMRVVAIAALMLSILSFFWRLFPLIRRMDKRGQLTLPDYSRVLGVMIAGFLLMLGIGLGFGVASL